MHVTRSYVLVVLLMISLMIAPISLDAQPLGCTVGPSSWAAVQQGLDTLFFGACTRHDLCYRDCNPPGGPYHGYGYKAGCDTVFALDLSAVCAAYTAILSFPNAEWIDSDEFLDDCLDLAAYAYGAVLTIGTFPFLNGQCERCNAWACGQLGRTYPATLCHINCGGPLFDRDDCDLFPFGPDCPLCPIGLDLQGNGFKLTGPTPPVYFDLDGDTTPNHTSWTRVQTKDGFLVFDRDGNGVIDDGRELFGNSTPLLLSAAVARHGYEALAEFDAASLGGNGDGLIDQYDAIFEHLQLWLDLNRDGVTQEGELKSLPEVGVSAISLAYYQDNREDQWGNVFRWSSPIYLEDGSESLSTDVFFKRLPEE